MAKENEMKEAYEKRDNKEGYVVPMTKEKYNEWSDTVKKSKEISRGQTGSKEHPRG